ncbi:MULTISPECIES: hypothetical protein [unclassified Anaeromyxobacter]|uniref:hypothetical protein n=1 Tax=unclassified Anaeromyxobacter TaxID=2620896 RepID=UPI001F5A75A3|nr:MULTISPECIES: hypothetical protein [unclassified Anaeromyxobacter]
MKPTTALLLASLLAGAPGAARAATFLETSVEETARTSQIVARGVVERTSSRWAGARIVTEVVVRVTSAWKGRPGERLRLLVPGGKVGEIAQTVDAAPTFEEGEEVVVFAGRRGNTWRVNGLALGKYRVEDGMATPGTEGARFAPRGLAAGERAVGRMSVDELERRVRSAR